MRYAFTALLLLFALTLAACSFSTNFVVINASDQPIQIRYKIAQTGIDPLVAARKPATLPTSRISTREWQELPSTQYGFDHDGRVVTVSLSPGVGLRIHQGGEWDEHYAGENFTIEELDIKGANGEINLKGDQVYKGFVPVRSAFYTFGPPTTLLTLTYK